MMYNIGDKLLCKKNFYFDNKTKTEVNLYAGVWYTVEMCDGFFGLIKIHNVYFNLYKIVYKGGMVDDYIYDYFCNKQDIRKLKLKKISNV